MMDEKHVRVFCYQVHKARQETCQTSFASFAIPTLVLVWPDKLDIKRHGILYIIENTMSFDIKFIRSILHLPLNAKQRPPFPLL